MPRYKIFIEYDGTNYSGWQIQPNANTVEEELEKAFSTILREEIDVIGQGRTDSGVHAEEQVAHFDVEQTVEKDKLLYALLGVLPRDISVWEMEEVSNDFHARFNGKSRQYRYQITTRPSPLLYRQATLVRGDINLPPMQACAELIVGTHDFEGFSKSDKDQANAVCTIDISQLKKDGHLLTYRIRGNRFVRHMVRRIVGTMLQVGRGERTPENFRSMLHHPEEGDISHGASAKGLILEKVEY